VCVCVFVCVIILQRGILTLVPGYILQMVIFLLQFMQKYPQFSTQDFYIFGESVCKPQQNGLVEPCCACA